MYAMPTSLSLFTATSVHCTTYVLCAHAHQKSPSNLSPFRCKDPLGVIDPVRVLFEHKQAVERRHKREGERRLALAGRPRRSRD